MKLCHSCVSCRFLTHRLHLISSETFVTVFLTVFSLPLAMNVVKKWWHFFTFSKLINSFEMLHIFSALFNKESDAHFLLRCLFNIIFSCIFRLNLISIFFQPLLKLWRTFSSSHYSKSLVSKLRLLNRHFKPDRSSRRFFYQFRMFNLLFFFCYYFL